MKSTRTSLPEHILINGDFLCRSLTGIERFAYETCIKLDSLLESVKSADTTKQLPEFSILLPHNANVIPPFKNIQIILSEKEAHSFPVWEHFVFGPTAGKLHSLPLDFANVTPVFHPGIVVIHDIYAKLYPHDFTGRRDKLIRLYMCFMYRYAARHAKKIITVSEFSRKQIAREYHLREDSISVIPNGWDHFKKIQSDDSILEKIPGTHKQFYFTLGSLQKRKNLAWIVHYALNHKNDFFVISGKAVGGFVSDDIDDLKKLSNVILLGSVSDGQIKSLMKNCRAFIFPSYYEGFGIPPLEALSCGASVVCARSASLPEIYGNTVHWIDLSSDSVDIAELLKNPVEKPDSVLKKYMYEHTAEQLLEIITKVVHPASVE